LATDPSPAFTRPGEGVWHDQRVLVVKKGAVLPGRCVRCNQIANGAGYLGSFQWHHPALYLLLPIDLLVNMALIARKGVALFVPLCPTHVTQRRRSEIGSTLVALLGLVFLLAAIVGGQFFGWSGLVLVLAGATWGTIGGRSLAPVRIDDDYARFRGACPAFLAQLPSWSARAYEP
jgi:hypothetical protein